MHTSNHSIIHPTIHPILPQQTTQNVKTTNKPSIRAHKQRPVGSLLTNDQRRYGDNHASNHPVIHPTIHLNNISIQPIMQPVIHTTTHLTTSSIQPASQPFIQPSIYPRPLANTSIHPPIKPLSVDSSTHPLFHPCAT